MRGALDQLRLNVLIERGPCQLQAMFSPFPTVGG
jgi:hypothetical protein